MYSIGYNMNSNVDILIVTISFEFLKISLWLHTN